jgi:hypothetical protein
MRTPQFANGEYGITLPKELVGVVGNRTNATVIQSNAISGKVASANQYQITRIIDKGAATVTVDKDAPIVASIVEGTIVNEPKDWKQTIESLKMISVIADKKLIKKFEESTGNKGLDEVDDFIDGEMVDVLDHFFWGQMKGIALELGAVDGTPNTRSMTYELESKYGWKRVLVEGNPMHK